MNLHQFALRALLLVFFASTLPASPQDRGQRPQTRPAPGGGQGNRPPSGGGPGNGGPGGNRPNPGGNPGGDRPNPNPGGGQPSRPGNGSGGGNRPGGPGNGGGGRPNPGGGRPNPGPGSRPPSRPSRPPQWGRPPQNRPSYNFRPNDRNYLRRYYTRNLGYINRANRPHFLIGGFFPFAYISYLTPLPPQLYGYLPPPPPGYAMGYYDGYVVVYDPITYFIANVVDLMD